MNECYLCWPLGPRAGCPSCGHFHDPSPSPSPRSEPGTPPSPPQRDFGDFEDIVNNLNVAFIIQNIDIIDAINEEIDIIEDFEDIENFDIINTLEEEINIDYDNIFDNIENIEEIIEEIIIDNIPSTENELYFWKRQLEWETLTSQKKKDKKYTIFYAYGCHKESRFDKIIDKLRLIIRRIILKNLICFSL